MTINPKLLEPTLLWENSSPDSDYTSTGFNNRFSLGDITPYKALIFAFRNGNATYYQKVTIRQIGTGVGVMLGIQNVRRNATLMNSLSSLVMFFGDGYSDSTLDNSVCVPIAIYGTNIL